MNDEFLTILKKDHTCKIINHSNFDILLSIKPKKPKRKIIDFFLVKRNSYIILEDDLDFSKIYISFEGAE
jgi:hypothetical protein